MQKCESQERKPNVLQSSRTEHRKKPCNKRDAPAEKHGIWQKVSRSSKTRIRPRSSRFLKFGRYQHHLRRNPRKENSWWILEHRCTCKAGEPQKNWRPFEYPRILQRLSQPMGKGKHMRKQQYTFATLSSVTVQILEDTLAVLSPGKLCQRTRIFI